jgi:Tetracyclin repressor-like, C-terminal domain
VTQRPDGILAGLAEFADLYRKHFVQPRRDATRELLLRARDRGEIAANTNLEVTLDMLYGPTYHRLLHGHAPLTERFAQQVIDNVIAAISEKGSTGSR